MIINIISPFIIPKRGEGMRIKDIIKTNQPGTYSKLRNKKEELTEKDIKELMNHSSYRRRSGAIRQVR